MRSPFSRIPSLRLRAARGRLLCLISLPLRGDASSGLARELALVASASAPHLRRLTVYRQLRNPPLRPDDTVRAA